MADEGFGRNIQKIFGQDSDFADFVGRKLKAVTLSDDKETITFAFQDGHEAHFGVEGDCCSHSWIEHMDVPKDIEGEEITHVLDAVISQGGEGDYGDYLQVYNSKFRTAKGDIVLEYRNASNGYYGGYLVRK